MGVGTWLRIYKIQNPQSGTLNPKTRTHVFLQSSQSHCTIANAVPLFANSGLYRIECKCSPRATATTLPAPMQLIISKNKLQLQIVPCELALMGTITHLYAILIDDYEKHNRNSINPRCKYTVSATCLLATTQVQQYKTALLNVTLSSSGCWKTHFKATLLFVGSNVNWSCEIYRNSRRYYTRREAINKKPRWIFNFLGKWSKKSRV